MDDGADDHTNYREKEIGENNLHVDLQMPMSIHETSMVSVPDEI